MDSGKLVILPLGSVWHYGIFGKELVVVVNSIFSSPALRD